MAPRTMRDVAARLDDLVFTLEELSILMDDETRELLVQCAGMLRTRARKLWRVDQAIRRGRNAAPPLWMP